MSSCQHSGDKLSSNGVYVGPEKIPQNKPYILKDFDIVGIGWVSGAPLADINNEEKFVFKLYKENGEPSFSNRIQFQNEYEMDDIDEHLNALHCDNHISPKIPSSVSCKLPLKRKADKSIDVDQIKVEIKEEKKIRIITMDDDVVDLLSDSENELQIKQTDNMLKNIKLEPIREEPQKETIKDKIKCENHYMEYEAFDVKQEYLGYDDEPITVDSDSDSESDHWYLRLSQSSPGKPFIRKSQDRVEIKQEDSSYSQMDDDYGGFMENEEEEEYLDDLITIPTEPPEQTSDLNKTKSDEEELDDIIRLDTTKLPNSEPIEDNNVGRDEVDAFSSDEIPKEIEKSTEMPIVQPQYDLQSKVRKHSSRRQITNSQKEERKKRLKEIATKDKECDPDVQNSSNSSNKCTTNINKISSSNRGAFLTDSVQVVKPVKRKEESKDTKSKQKKSASPPMPETNSKQPKDTISSVDVENRIKQTDISAKDGHKSSKTKSKSHTSRSKSSHSKSHNSSETDKVRVPLKSLKPEIESGATAKSTSSHNKSHDSSKAHEARVPLKSVKPLTDCDKTHSGKPFSKVEPLPPKKSKKSVHFSDDGPEVHIFEIEPGNKLKKTSLVKMSLLDSRQMPVFSLEKITLMKILRWNPHWLDEQINNNDPPPILGHNNTPMSTFHSYVNHQQYIQLVGDLLLMEIWECLSMAYLKMRNQSKGLQMRIGSLPPVPTQERCYELFSLSVNISLPSNGPKSNVPRVGEIILATFGPDNAKRFFFVYNVRCLPSPPNNIHSFYSISLHATFTDKMKSLRQGEVIVGVSLAYINKELNLFEAMEYLAGSPLSEAILRPEPRHFQSNYIPGNPINSQWTKTLNSSQQTAVMSSVSAALGDKPSIQMVQGPPGTDRTVMSSLSAALVDKPSIQMVQGPPGTDRAVMNSLSAALEDKPSLYMVQGPPGTDRAVMSSLSAALEDKPSLYMVQGPPGTGNYRFQSESADRVVMSSPRARRQLAAARDSRRGALPGRTRAAPRPAGGGMLPVLATYTSLRDVGSQQLATRDAARFQAEPVPHPGLQEERAKKYGLGESLFSRLTSSSEQAPASGRVVLLNQQYRMHPDIADYPNRAFYGGLVRSVSPQRPPDLPMPPYTIVSISSGDKGQVEVNTVDSFQGQERDVVVVSLARSQGVGFLTDAGRMNVMLTRAKHALLICLNPHALLLESSQGVGFLTDAGRMYVMLTRAKHALLICLNPHALLLENSQGIGFLTDAGRMNVMLTRAKHALLICLNPHAFLKNHQWRTLVEDAQRRNMYRVLPNQMCQPAAGPVPHDDILKYIAYK
ncbi:putative splicing endonuclease positive effector sen1 [Operophtera brumata]|uniref:Putative splicing endonuclease positive effector sen1 n=1 Tax=Operophtera brumata TaxID=104452 RepID=A0A0L7L1W8_OPEBR|nr:putative splicing endonuclease positive effector sen1 [Operophtera brumata]